MFDLLHPSPRNGKYIYVCMYDMRILSRISDALMHIISLAWVTKSSSQPPQPLALFLPFVLFRS